MHQLKNSSILVVGGTGFIGTKILVVAYVIRENEVTAMPRYKLDTEFAGIIFIEEPLLISVSLNYCRF